MGKIFQYAFFSLHFDDTYLISVNIKVIRVVVVLFLLFFSDQVKFEGRQVIDETPAFSCVTVFLYMYKEIYVDSLHKYM